MKLWRFQCWNCETFVLGRVLRNRVVPRLYCPGDELMPDTRTMRCAACKQGDQPNHAVPICPECAEPYLECETKSGPCSLCREEAAHQRDVDRQDRHDAAKER